MLSGSIQLHGDEVESSGVDTPPFSKRSTGYNDGVVIRYHYPIAVVITFSSTLANGGS